MLKSFLLTLGVGSLLAFNAAAGETIPYNPDFGFGSGDVPEGWAAEDINEDGRTWSLYYGALSVNGDFFQTFDMDDWLYSPAFSLEKGKSYLLSFKPAMNYNQNPNVFPLLEVKYGTSPSVDALTNILMETTVINDYFPQNPTRLIITPEADGDYYIGFHATGIATTGLKVTELNIKEALMPTAVTDITITKTGTYGQPDVKVSFRAPATDASGNALAADGLSKIVITRSGIPVTTIENPAPGELIEFDDSPAFGSGNYVWRFVPYGSVNPETGIAEEGFAAESAPIFLGVNVPATPVVKAVEDGNSGTVTITWDPVTTDRDGEEMPAEFIDYQVLVNGQYLVATGAESPYTFQACNSDEQIYVTCGVIAKSSYGSGTGIAPTFVAGAPYTSYAENFVDAVPSHDMLLGINAKKPARYALYDDEMLAMTIGITEGDADGTNGCYAAYSDEAFTGAYIGLGKFDVSAMIKPALTFYTYFASMGNTASANVLELYVTNENNEDELVYTYNMADYAELHGWQKVTMPLDDFKGQQPVLKLYATIINMPYILIDHIALTDVVEHDLSVSSISAPAVVKPGEEVTFTATVENCGTQAMEAATAVLIVNGNAVAETEVPALPAGKFITVDFTHVLTLLDGEQVEVAAKIMEDDDNSANNTSATVTVTNKLPKFPTVNDLSGELSDNGSATLTWSEPQGEMPAEEQTESFEDAEAGTHNYGSWTFVDNDGNVAGNYEGIPGLEDYSGPVVVSGASYPVFKAHTGDNCLVFTASEEGVTDDYLISPELSGEAQTVSFFVRGYDTYGYFYESFRFLTSTTGNAIEDFTELESNQDCSWITGREWRFCSFELPAGTTYFAISYCPEEYYGIALMVDDVTFTAGDSGEPLELIGYNVYRSQTLITEQPVTETSFVDTEVPEGDNTYQVTAVYNRGESAGSNSVVLKKATGIVSANVDGLTVSTGANSINISAAEPVAVQVFAVDGTLVATVKVNGTATVNVAPGMYIVSTANAVHKVVVK